MINQEDLNDLVRDLNLTKSNSELLASRLQQWNLLAPHTKVTFYRQRSQDLTSHFSTDGELCYCNNVSALFQSIGMIHDQTNWRLFTDSSKESIKAVLLHNGNRYPSVPVAYSTTPKETYYNLQLILDKLNYHFHLWYVCAHLKGVALLRGLQLGDSRARNKHYIEKTWSQRIEEEGQHNVVALPFAPKNKIILPPLHIKLGLFKQFVKGSRKDSPAFEFLHKCFPKLSDAKIKDGVFVGPQIQKLILNDMFDKTLNETELDAWKSFKQVCLNFLGVHKSDDFEDVVANLLYNYHIMGCKMSLKVHFLHSHLPFFHENLGAVSDEHGERFHQDIAVIEKRFKGKWSTGMLAEYCWSLKQDKPEQEHKRRRR